MGAQSERAPTLNLHSGIVDFRFMTGDLHGVKHFRWAGTYWSYRPYRMAAR